MLPRLFVGLVVGATALRLLATLAWGQVEGALVTRRGAVIQGTVEGSIVALQETASVAVKRGALVAGDVVLASEQDQPAPAAGPGPVTAGGNVRRVSARVTLTVDDATSLKGRQRAAATFELPRAEKARQPAGTNIVTLQNAKDKDPNFGTLKDLTIRQNKREVRLPAGTYGDISVENGSLVLGTAGALTRDRYYFHSLAVGANGSVDLLGPVVVVTGQLGSIQGKLGHDRFTNWLDLRVTAGDVLLGADSDVHGVVTASESAVTLGPRAKLRGGLVCDQATVGIAARFTGVSPDWSKESSGNSLPLFIHKAARLQSRLPELIGRYGNDYAVSSSYDNDEPVLLLAGTRRTGLSGAASSRPKAFFDACCTLFDGTGFARGSLAVSDLSAQARGFPDINVVTLEREQFEDNLWAIGRQKEPRNSIALIRDNPELLQRFMERAVKLARDAATKAAKEGGR